MGKTIKFAGLRGVDPCPGPVENFAGFRIPYYAYDYEKFDRDHVDVIEKPKFSPEEEHRTKLLRRFLKTKEGFLWKTDSRWMRYASIPLSLDTPAILLPSDSLIYRNTGERWLGHKDERFVRYIREYFDVMSAGMSDEEVDKLSVCLTDFGMHWPHPMQIANTGSRKYPLDQIITQSDRELYHRLADCLAAASMIAATPEGTVPKLNRKKSLGPYPWTENMELYRPKLVTLAEYSNCDLRESVPGLNFRDSRRFRERTFASKRFLKYLDAIIHMDSDADSTMWFMLVNFATTIISEGYRFNSVDACRLKNGVIEHVRDDRAVRYELEPFVYLEGKYDLKKVSTTLRKMSNDFSRRFGHACADASQMLAPGRPRIICSPRQEVQAPLQGFIKMITHLYEGASVGFPGLNKWFLKRQNAFLRYAVEHPELGLHGLNGDTSNAEQAIGDNAHQCAFYLDSVTAKLDIFNVTIKPSRFGPMATSKGANNSGNYSNTRKNIDDGGFGKCVYYASVMTAALNGDQAMTSKLVVVVYLGLVLTRGLALPHVTYNVQTRSRSYTLVCCHNLDSDDIVELFLSSTPPDETLAKENLSVLSREIACSDAFSGFGLSYNKEQALATGEAFIPSKAAVLGKFHNSEKRRGGSAWAHAMYQRFQGLKKTDPERYVRLVKLMKKHGLGTPEGHFEGFSDFRQRFIPEIGPDGLTNEYSVVECLLDGFSDWDDASNFFETTTHDVEEWNEYFEYFKELGRHYYQDYDRISLAGFEEAIRTIVGEMFSGSVKLAPENASVISVYF